jgi:hypothetical protein
MRIDDVGCASVHTYPGGSNPANPTSGSAVNEAASPAALYGMLYEERN